MASQFKSLGQRVFGSDLKAAPDDYGSVSPARRGMMGVVRPAGQAAVDLSLDAVKRLTNASLGEPISVVGKARFNLQPGRLHYIDTSTSDVVAYLTGFQGAGGKIGASCTVVNNGPNVIYVIPGIPGATIDGWTSYPLLRRGSAATIIAISKNRFACLSHPQKMMWPKLSCLVTGATMNFTSTDNGTDKNIMAMRLSDGSIRTASGTLTASAAAFTSQLVHFWAIPDGDRQFSILAATTGNPESGTGPTGYSVYKYISSWNASATNLWAGMNSSPDGWMVKNDEIVNNLILQSSAAFTPSATTWAQCDGTTDYTNLTTYDPFIYCPAMADQIMVRGFMQTTNLAQHFQLGTGTVASPPYTSAAATQARHLTIVAIGAGLIINVVNTWISPLNTGGLVYAFELANSTGVFRLQFCGYHNPLFNID